MPEGLKIQLRGLSGVIRAGGRDIATLGPWSRTRGENNWQVEAQVKECNQFLLEHAIRFELRLNLGEQHQMIWRNVSVVLNTGEKLILSTPVGHESVNL